jgi:5-methylcytosine-specific restriction endonuclease McrA
MRGQIMKLTTLKPRLATLNTQRAPTLTTQEAGARPTGSAWQATRRRIQLRDGSMCAKCGLLWLPHRDVVDHRIPRWAGGSDEDGNLWLLHDKPCHEDKSAEEAAMRARGGYVMPEWVAARMRST